MEKVDFHIMSFIVLYSFLISLVCALYNYNTYIVSVTFIYIQLSFAYNLLFSHLLNILFSQTNSLLSLLFTQSVTVSIRLLFINEERKNFLINCIFERKQVNWNVLFSFFYSTSAPPFTCLSLLSTIIQILFILLFSQFFFYFYIFFDVHFFCTIKLLLTREWSIKYKTRDVFLV